MSGKIICEACGAEVHVIKTHLKNEHGPDSAMPMTYEEYRAKFPDAPVMSERAKQKHREKLEAAKEAQAASMPSMAASVAGKHKLGDLLGMPGGLKGKSGKSIEVTVLDRQDNPIVPYGELDKGFVFIPDLVKTIAMAIEVNIPLYLFGPPGVGKSDINAQICAVTNRQLVRVQHTINTEESHIVGQWIVDKEVDEAGNQISITKWKPGPLQLAVKYGLTYLADEYDRGNPCCLSVYQAILEGKPLFTPDADDEWRYIEPHPDFRFIATGNTNGSGDQTGLYQSANRQDAATFERFGIVYEVGYLEKEDEINMLRAKTGLVESDAEKVHDFVSRVRDMYPHEMPLTIGPRVMIAMSNIGKMRGSFMDGVSMAFANRLPPAKREAAIQVASRVFG